MDLSVPRAQHIEIYNLSFSHVAETFDMHGTKMTGFLLPSSLPVVSFFSLKRNLQFSILKSHSFSSPKRNQGSNANWESLVRCKTASKSGKYAPFRINGCTLITNDWYILESLSRSDEF